MTLPNFLIIGAAKSGTSSLYNYLGQHPQVYLSPVKGPCFFAFEDQKVEFFGPGDQEVLDRNVITDMKRYQALFDGISSETAFGEASVLYLYESTAATRIKHHVPKVKLIAILRNPVDRAFSSFSHLRRDGREPIDNFAEAIQAEDARVKAGWEHLWHYTRLGFYYTQLKRYFDLFSPDQIAVYTYEEFKNNPYETLQALFHFLEIDVSFMPDMSVKHNVSGTPKLMDLHKFLRNPNKAKSIVRPFLPASLRRHLWRTAMQRNISIDKKPKLSNEIREYLVDIYKTDVVKLQSLIQRDLSTWLDM